MGNIFSYRSSSTGSVLENIIPVERGVYFPVHSKQSWEYTGNYSPSCQSNTENQLFHYCSPRKDNTGIVIENVCMVTRVWIYGEIQPEPSGFPLGSGYISSYIPPLFTIQIQRATVYNSVQQCETVYNSVYQCTTVQDKTVQGTTVYNSIVYHSVQKCTTVYKRVHQCTTVYNSVQQCKTVYNTVQHIQECRSLSFPRLPTWTHATTNHYRQGLPKYSTERNCTSTIIILYCNVKFIYVLYCTVNFCNVLY